VNVLRLSQHTVVQIQNTRVYAATPGFVGSGGEWMPSDRRVYSIGAIATTGRERLSRPRALYTAITADWGHGNDGLDSLSESL